MRRAWFTLALAPALYAVPAHAQWLVTDPAVEVSTAQGVVRDAQIVENGVQQINNQVHQITQLDTTIASIAHGNYFGVTQLVPELAGAALTDPLAADPGTLTQLMSGLATTASELGALSGQYLQQTQLFSPTGGDYEAAQLNLTAQSLASQLAIASTIAGASQQRMNLLPGVISRAGSSADIKEAEDATGRLTGEVALQTAQANQIAAVQIMQQTQQQVQAAHDEQAWRCSSEQLVQDAQAAANAAAAGTVSLIGTNTGTPCMVTSASAVTLAAPSGAPVMASTAGTDDGGTLNTLLSQSWGATASANAQALGVNPTALAATCVVESNCTNVSASSGSTVSGPFQMTNATYAADLNTATSSDPSLLSQVSDKSDPATESIAASQDLKSAAASLQADGIANPTVLDARGYYNFGAGYGATLAQASDSQNMAALLPTYTASQLASNGISQTETVGQWRQSVISKIGGAASQPVLISAAA